MSHAQKTTRKNDIENIEKRRIMRTWSDVWKGYAIFSLEQKHRVITRSKTHTQEWCHESVWACGLIYGDWVIYDRRIIQGLLQMRCVYVCMCFYHILLSHSERWFKCLLTSVLPLCPLCGTFFFFPLCYPFVIFIIFYLKIVYL
jgi:hypothetical protein